MRSPSTRRSSAATRGGASRPRSGCARSCRLLSPGRARPQPRLPPRPTLECVRRRVDLWLLGTALAAAFVTVVAALWVSEGHVGPVIWAHDAAGFVVVALVWSKLRVIR